MKKIALLTMAFAMGLNSLPILSMANAQNLFPDSGITSGKVGIFNCDAPGDKQKTGAIIGAVVGGVIGNKVSKDNKTLGTVIGAAVGGAAGSYVGCRLQRKDQEKLAKDSERALAIGQNATFTNAETGITGQTNVISNTVKTNAAIHVSPNVNAPTSLILMGGEYAASKDLVLKASPISTAKSVGGIGAGEIVNVLGRTTGKTQWAAVSQNGVITGYAPLASLKSTGRIASVGDASGQQMRVINIPVTSVCRDVTQTISQNGKPIEDGGANRKACVQADGSWKSI